MSVVDYLARINVRIENSNERFAQLYIENRRVHPIPFFGDILNAEILTVGLNPSSKEFNLNRNWPEELTPHGLYDRLTHYFENQPHNWFARWSNPLDIIGISYTDLSHRRAAHVDLSQRATRAVSSLQQAYGELFRQMVVEDLVSFYELLHYAHNLKGIIFAGSVTNRYYMSGFLREYSNLYGYSFLPKLPVAAQKPNGFSSDLISPSGQRWPTIFLNSTHPARLAASLKQHRNQILGWLNDSPPV